MSQEQIKKTLKLDKKGYSDVIINVPSRIELFDNDEISLENQEFIPKLKKRYQSLEPKQFESIIFEEYQKLKPEYSDMQDKILNGSPIQTKFKRRPSKLYLQSLETPLFLKSFSSTSFKPATKEQI